MRASCVSVRSGGAAIASFKVMAPNAKPTLHFVAGDEDSSVCMEHKLRMRVGVCNLVPRFHDRQDRYTAGSRLQVAIALDWI